jgi:hypothetical protein
MDEQLRSNWAALMNSLLELAHPLAGEITAPMAGLSLRDRSAEGSCAKGSATCIERGQVCRAANKRYLEALASVTGSTSLLQEAAQVCCPVTRNGKRYRGLNALAQNDHALLLALSRGELALTCPSLSCLI